MGRPTIFTWALARKIGPWIQDGASPADIAQRIGCTVGTLRVRCSQLGISLKPRDSQSLRRNQASSARAHITGPSTGCFQVTLNQPFMDSFEDSARARGLSSAALAQTLLEVIIEDGLYEAVLDEGSPAHQRVTGSILRG
jgi:hypothetical protein